MAWNYWINLIKEEVLHIGIRKEEKADIDMEPCFFPKHLGKVALVAKV